MRAFLLTALLLSASSPALACRPMEGDVFDDLSSPGFALVTAKVTDLTITKSSDSESCFAVSYATTEMIAGDIAERFRVETCANEGPITEADLAETPDDYGFSEGATVLVGIIKPADQPDALRYAIPNCWGPFHITLDGMSPDERNAYVADIKAGLLGADVEAP